MFNILSRQLGCVFWIRSLDWHQQIYVSNTYEHIWERSVRSLHDNPDGWFDSLVNDDREETFRSVQCRMNDFDENCMQFRIMTPCGAQKFIHDTCFIISDLENKPIAFAGIGEEVSEQQWDQGVCATANRYAEFANIVTNELSFSMTPANENARLSSHYFHLDDKKVRLTNKEYLCLHHLLQGRTAKQTAQYIHLSPRTIERHLDHVREKLNCRTKLLLLNKLKQGIIS